MISTPIKPYYVVSLGFLCVSIPYTANTSCFAGYPTSLSGLARKVPANNCGHPTDLSGHVLSHEAFN
jgi:hypothetical protein